MHYHIAQASWYRDLIPSACLLSSLYRGKTSAAVHAVIHLKEMADTCTDQVQLRIPYKQ